MVFIEDCARAGFSGTPRAAQSLQVQALPARGLPDQQLDPRALQFLGS